MYSHTTDNDLYTFISQRGYCLSELVMRIGIVAVKQADLNNRDLQRVLFRIKRDSERCENTVVETSFDSLGLDSG